MKHELVVQLHGDFEQLVQLEPDSGLEFWMARDLQPVLGYARWENFARVIEKARIACENSGYTPTDHFRGVTKMLDRCSVCERDSHKLAF